MGIGDLSVHKLGDCRSLPHERCSNFGKNGLLCGHISLLHSAFIVVASLSSPGALNGTILLEPKFDQLLNLEVRLEFLWCI